MSFRELTPTREEVHTSRQVTIIPYWRGSCKPKSLFTADNADCTDSAIFTRGTARPVLGRREFYNTFWPYEYRLISLNTENSAVSSKLWRAGQWADCTVGQIWVSISFQGLGPSVVFITIC